MKIVSLCKDCAACPEVKIDGDRVEIGEEGNLCILTLKEFDEMKNLIKSDVI